MSLVDRLASSRLERSGDPSNGRGAGTARRSLPGSARRRLSRSAAAAVRPLYLAEAIERRLMLVTFAGTANADIITIDISGANIVINNLSTGTSSTTSDAVETQIIVNGNGGDDTISVLRNGLNATTINGGTGADTISVGNTNFDANINANVTANGGTELDTLIVNDTGDAAGNDAVTITATTFKKTAIATTLTFGAAVELIETVNFNLGAQPETVSILGTSSGVATTLNAGGGNDTVTVGDDFDTFFSGALNINGAAGANFFIFDDTGDAGADAYTFGAAGANGTFTKASALSTVVFDTGNNVRLDAPVGVIAHTFTVLDSTAPITINAGDGNDTLNFGDNVADLELSGSSLIFNGEAGADLLNVNDTNNALPDTYTVTATFVGITGTGSVAYSTIEGIVVNAGSASNAINITSTSAAPPTINGGGGNDTITVGGGDFDTNLDGNPLINGGLGVDSLVVSDAADVGGFSYSISSGFFGHGDFITWATSGNELVEQFALNAADDADAINVSNTNAATTVVVNAGDGNDTIDVGNGVADINILGAVTINGELGADTINFADAGEAAAETYTVASTGITKNTMSVSVDFSSATIVLNIPTGALAQTINLNDTDGNAVSVNAGSGNDTINVGNGDYDTNLGDSTIVGGAGTDRVVIDDSLDPNVSAYTFAAATFAKGTDILNFDATLENLVVNTTGQSDTLNIENVAASLNLTINGGAGNDTLVAAVGSDLDAAINGDVVFDGSTGSDRVNLFDTADAVANDTYTITGSAIGTSDAAFGTLLWGAAVEFINFVANGGANAITPGGFFDGESVTISGGSGNDTISNDTGNDFGVDWDNVTVRFDGSGGTDLLTLNDSLDVDNLSYTIGADTISMPAAGSTGAVNLTYDTFETLLFLANNNASAINVTGSDNEVTTLSVDAGDGNDPVIAGGGDLESIDDVKGFGNATTISLVGGAGSDQVRFDDTAGVTGTNTLTVSTALLITSTITVAFSTMESERVDGPAAAATFNVDATLSTLTGVSLNGGAGNDTVNLGAANDLDVIDAPIVFDGGGGSDTLFANDSADTSNVTYTLTSTTFDRPVAPDFDAVTFANIERVIVTGNAFANTFTVSSSPNGTVFDLRGDDNNDTFNVGSPADNVDPIDGVVSVTGGLGTDTLNFNDQASAVANAIAINGDVISRAGADNVFFAPSIETVIVNGGTGNHTIAVNALTANVTTFTINAGSGNNAITVGNGDFDSNINHSLTINAAGGTDTITVSDATDNDVGDTYTLSANVFQDSGNSATVTMTYSLAENFILNLPGGNETTNVNASISGNTVINGGAGNDTVNMGNGDLDSVGGIVTFNGEGGTNDRLNLDNSADPVNGNNILTFSAPTTLTGQLTVDDSTPDETVQWGNSTETVALVDGAAPSTFNVNALANGSAVSISAGGGNDTVNAGGGDFDLNLAAGATVPMFDGGGGTDVLNFKDGSDDAGNDGMTIQFDQVLKGSQLIGYTLFESMTIAGSPQPTTYVVRSLTTPTTINAGAGNDIIQLGDAVATVNPGTGDILNSLNINAGDGADTVNVGNGDLDELNGFPVTIDGGIGANVVVANDILDTTNPTYDVFIATLTRTASDFVGATIANAEFRLQANNGLDTINYNSTLVGTLNGNGGNDTFNIFGSTAVTIHGGAGLDIIKVNQDETGTAVATLDASEDLSATEIYIGGTLNVATSTNGDTAIDTGSLAVVKGTFNVNNNFVVVRTGSLPFVVDKLARGYNANLWNGTPAGGVNGVINSAFANTSAASDGVGSIAIGALPGQLNKAVYRGVNLIAGNILVSHLLNGDANFDRIVDFNDLVVLAQNYNLTGKSWGQGNFNYDAGGAVDFNDLVPLAQNYNQSLPGAPAIVAPIALPASLRAAVRTRDSAAVLGSLSRDVLHRQTDELPTTSTGKNKGGRLA